MFIPIVPFIPHTTVVNKTVVYSDTVLNIKEMGSNLNVTSISGVGEYSFQSCLETVFKNNPNVTFNTIQYSKNQNKVYFYTDGVVSTKEWNEKNITKTAYSSVNVDVLQDLKDLFANPQKGDKDSISIYDVMVLLRNTHYKVDDLKERYRDIMRDKIKDSIDRDYTISIHDFDYYSNELSISLIGCYKPSAQYKFSKKDGDLYMTEEKNGSWHKDKILPLLGKNLSDLYDSFLETKDFYAQKSPKIRPINSGFNVNVDKYGIDLFISKGWLISNGWLSKEFELSRRNSSDKYSYECNSNNVLELLMGKETELFKRIFVKIDDCPEWMRPSLYEERQKHFAKEQRQFELQQQRDQALEEKQVKKEKRLELVRKIFPFIKSDKDSN